MKCLSVKSNALTDQSRPSGRLFWLQKGDRIAQTWVPSPLVIWYNTPKSIKKALTELLVRAGALINISFDNIIQQVFPWSKGKLYLMQHE